MGVAKFGFELEIAYWDFEKFRKMMKDAKLRNLTLDQDGSIYTEESDSDDGDGGVEIKFTEPVTSTRSFASQTRKISKFIIDNNLKFLNGGDNSYSFRRKKHILNESNGTSCGLHIHYDVPTRVAKNVEMIRNLHRLTIDRERKLVKLAGRVNLEYAPPIRHIIKEDRGWSGNTNKNATTDYIEECVTCRDKYCGLNICNLFQWKSTVEFRYAHAAIITDHDRTMEYFHACKEIVEEAFEL